MISEEKKTWLRQIGVMDTATEAAMAAGPKVPEPASAPNGSVLVAPEKPNGLAPPSVNFPAKGDVSPVAAKICLVVAIASSIETVPPAAKN